MVGLKTFLLIGFAALLAGGNAAAIERGMLSDGGRYASGGIGQDEIAQLAGERGTYSLKVVTAASKTGAHLADVQVRISRSSGEVMFDKPLAGPWLLADLPPGAYTVEASLGSEVHKQAVTIRARGDRKQVVFYFAVDADVLPPAAPDERT